VNVAAHAAQERADEQAGANGRGDGGARTGRRWGWSAVFALLAIGVVGVGVGWSARTVFVPAEVELASDAPLVVTATEGSVGRDVSFAATVTWEGASGVAGRASGTLTAVRFEAGELVDQGDVVYEVDLQPVVIAQGATPASRALTAGARGDDVAQLQQLLTELGHYDGELDGVFGAAVTTAVADWQEQLGLARSGAVPDGGVLFVPSLPLRAVLTAEVALGDQVTAGDRLLEVLPEAPSVEVVLSSDQRNVVPLEGRAVLESELGDLEALIASAAEDGQGLLTLELTAPDGGAVCGERCAELVDPPGTRTLRARLEVVPQTDGVVLPASVIRTTETGEASVRLVDGSDVEVRIVEAADGLVVLEGIEAGTDVVAP
jgi:peptidoglycan hydrolase-like protein with peptidoglycan-binding domain